MTRLRVRSTCRSEKVKEESIREDWNTCDRLLWDVINLLERTTKSGRARAGTSDAGLAYFSKQFDAVIKQAEDNEAKKEYFCHLIARSERFLFPLETHNAIRMLLSDYEARINSDPELRKKKEKIKLYLNPVVFPSEEQSASSQHPIPAGGSVNSTPAGGSVNPIPAGGSVNPIPAGGSVNPIPAGGSVNPIPAGDFVNPIPAGDFVNPIPAGDFVNPTPAGDFVNPIPVGDFVNPTPAGDFVNPTPAGGFVNPIPAGDFVNPIPAGDSVNPIPAGDSVNPIPAEESGNSTQDFIEIVGPIVDKMNDSQVSTVFNNLDNLIGTLNNMSGYRKGSDHAYDTVHDPNMSLLDTVFHPKHFITEVGNGLKEDSTNIDVIGGTPGATQQSISAADAIMNYDVLMSSSMIPAADDLMENDLQPSYERIISPDVIENRNSVPVFGNHVEPANESVLAPAGVSKPLLAEMVPTAEGRLVFSVQQPNVGSHFECKETLQLTSMDKSVVNEVGDPKCETDEVSDKGYGSGFDSRASSATPPHELTTTPEHPSSVIDLSDSNVFYSCSLYSSFDYVLATPEIPGNVFASNQVAKNPSTGVKLEPKDSLTLQAAKSGPAPQLPGSVRQRFVPVITIDDSDAPSASSAASSVAAPTLNSNARKVPFKIVQAEFVPPVRNNPLKRKLGDRDDVNNVGCTSTKLVKLGQPELVSVVAKNPLKRKQSDTDSINNVGKGRAKFVKLGQPQLVSAVAKNPLNKKQCDTDTIPNVGNGRPKLVRLVRPANSNVMPSSSQLSSVTASRSSNLPAVSSWAPNYLTSYPSNSIASSSQQTNFTATPLRPAFVVSSSQKFNINTPSTQPPKFKVTSAAGPSNITILSSQPSNPIASFTQPPTPVVPSSRRVNIKIPAPRSSSPPLPVGERTKSGMLVYMGNKRVNKVSISSAVASAASQKTQTQTKPSTAENTKLIPNGFSGFNFSASLIKPEATQPQPLAPHNANITSFNDISAYSNSSPFANSAHKSSPLTSLPGPYFNNSFRANRSGSRNTNNARSNENSNSTAKRRGRKPKTVNNACSNALGLMTSVQSSPVTSFSASNTSSFGVTVPNSLVKRVSIPSASIPNTSQSKAAAPKVSGPRNGRSRTTKAWSSFQCRKPRVTSPPAARPGVAQPPSRRRRPANIDPAKREAHNRSERERRLELTKAFGNAREILLQMEPPHRFPKVKILATSVLRFDETYENAVLPVNDMSSGTSLPHKLKERRAKKMSHILTKHKFERAEEQEHWYQPKNVIYKLKKKMEAFKTKYVMKLENVAQKVSRIFDLF